MLSIDNCHQVKSLPCTKVRDSFAGGVSHLSHKRGKMGANRFPSTLQSIQRAHDDGVAACIWSKFRSKDSPNLFLARRSDVSVKHIPGFDLKVIQSGKH